MGVGEALQTFAFTTCSIASDVLGFRYEYSCCRIEGLGACEGIVTAWTDIESTATGQMDALTKHEVVCPNASTLASFVLDAKNPGADSSEVRFVYECCKIADWRPVSVGTEVIPLARAFENYEGVYYPTARNEGRVEMAAYFLHARPLTSQTYFAGCPIGYTTRVGSKCYSAAILGAETSCGNYSC